MKPRFKDAVSAYVVSTLTDSAGVDEIAMLALYKLRGEAQDLELRSELDGIIARVELAAGRYRLPSENLPRRVQMPDEA